jgi:hypothetical protein
VTQDRSFDGGPAAVDPAGSPEATWSPPDPDSGLHRRRGRRARKPKPWRVRVVVALAACSGVGTLLAGLSPTGSLVGDTLWSVLLGASVVLAGSRARRWSLLTCSGVALATASGWMVPVAIVALSLALVSVFLSRRDRVLDAVVALLSVQALVRIDWPTAPRGASALVAGVAVGVVLLSGWRAASRRWRRRTGRVALVAVAVGVVATVAFGVVGLLTIDDVVDGVSLAQDGVDATRVDEQAAASLFRSASALLDDAASWLDSPLLAPVRLVPVVAQQQRAVAVATTSARDLAATAAEGAALVERDGLRPDDGRIDTAAVRALVPPLQAAVDALASAEADLASLSSPWLVAPIADRLAELEDAVAETLPVSRLALQGAEVTPGMLGADGTRRWLVMVTTPAETRLLGGFVGNWALLEAVDGAIDVVADGGAAEVNRQLAVDERQVDASLEYRRRYSRYRPDDYFQNSSASPDFPSAARVASSFFTQSTGIAIDGVMAMDPFALGALVDLGGTIELPTLGRQFTGAELSAFLVTELYEYDDDVQDEIFADAIDAAVEGLTDGRLPAPGAMADALAPMAAEGRILLWSPVADEESFFTALGASGALPANDGQDFLFVGLANVNPNKIDTYLRREISYRVDYDPSSGSVAAEATLVLTNEATADLPPVVLGNAFGAPVGTARTYVSLYSPLFLNALTVNGEASGVESQQELGWSIWSRRVDVPRGGSVTLRWTLRGVVDAGGYRFTWRPQPLVIPPTLDLEVGSAGAASPWLRRDGEAESSFTLDVVP